MGWGCWGEVLNSLMMNTLQHNNRGKKQILEAVHPPPPKKKVPSPAFPWPAWGPTRCTCSNRGGLGEDTYPGWQWGENWSTGSCQGQQQARVSSGFETKSRCLQECRCSCMHGFSLVLTISIAWRAPKCVVTLCIHVFCFTHSWVINDTMICPKP